MNIINENLVLAFTIILSFVGIIISIAGLILSIIYILKLSKISKTQDDINKSLDKMDIIKMALIDSCVMYSDKGMICGRDVVKEVCEKYSCDEWTAISLIKSNNFNKEKK